MQDPSVFLLRNPSWSLLRVLHQTLFLSLQALMGIILGNLRWRNVPFSGKVGLLNVFLAWSLKGLSDFVILRILHWAIGTFNLDRRLQFRILIQEHISFCLRTLIVLFFVYIPSKIDCFFYLRDKFLNKGWCLSMFFVEIYGLVEWCRNLSRFSNGLFELRIDDEDVAWFFWGALSYGVLFSLYDPGSP